jgi:hypothetical protein
MRFQLLKSRYGFAQRTASAPTARDAFDGATEMASTYFGFITQVVSGPLVFNYAADRAGAYYDVSAGTEDQGADRLRDRSRNYL